MLEPPPSYVFLIRHAKRERTWDKPELDQDMEKWVDLHDCSKVAELTAKHDEAGLPRTFSLAGTLCDQLELMNVTIVHILCSEHLVSRQTAQIYELVLQIRFKCNTVVTPENALTPTGVKPERDEEKLAQNVSDRINLILAENQQPGQSQGLIVIGHQPGLTHLAQELLKPRPLPAGILPIGNSEIACIRLGKSAALLWLLTEKSAEVSTDLKAKIASKFDVAKFLLGALILNLGLYLNSDVWTTNSQVESFLLASAMLFAFLAFGFTIATLFAYDRLNMPSEFWGGEGKPDATPRPWRINRPPGSYQLILFYEMIHAWKCFFIPAIVFATSSLGLMVVKLAYNYFVWPDIGAGIMSLIMLGIILLGLIVSLAIYGTNKPKLGFDD